MLPDQPWLAKFRLKPPRTHRGLEARFSATARRVAENPPSRVPGLTGNLAQLCRHRANEAQLVCRPASPLLYDGRSSAAQPGCVERERPREPTLSAPWWKTTLHADDTLGRHSAGVIPPDEVSRAPARIACACGLAAGAAGGESRPTFQERAAYGTAA